MKVKLKLDKNSIQQFFLEHVEKILFAGVAVLFLLFVYQAVSSKGYEQRPEALQESVTRATQHIDAGPQLPAAKPENECKFADFASTISKTYETVVAEISPTPWDTVIKSMRSLRDEPKILPVRFLHGEGGRGPLAEVLTQDRPAPVAAGGRGRHGAAPPAPVGGGGEQEVVHGKRWVLLVGAIPYKEQIAEFKNCFSGAAYEDPSADVPNYAGFFVERAEGGPDVPAAKLKWDKFFYTKTMTDAAKAWHSKGEVVDEKFVKASLCSPLPPVTDRTWGAEAACDPQIPLLPQEKRSEAQAAAEGKGAEIAHPAESAARAAGGEEEDPFGGGARPPEPKAVVNKQAAVQADKEPGYLLFRFFDFDVQPGKQYRYRVFLAVRNPNYRVLAKYLADPSLAASAYIGKGQESRDANGLTGVKVNEAEAKWSDPSPAIAVPDDVQLLAGRVTPPRGALELGGQVHVLKWDEQTGLKTWKEFPVCRGKLADFPECDFPARAAYQGAGPKDVPKSIPVDFLTRQLVLDMTGGELLFPKDRTATRPAEMLVLDNESGNLVIHDELSDEAVYQSYKKISTTESPSETPHGGPASKPAVHGPARHSGPPAPTEDFNDYDNGVKKPKK